MKVFSPFFLLSQGDSTALAAHAVVFSPVLDFAKITVLLEIARILGP